MRNADSHESPLVEVYGQFEVIPILPFFLYQTASITKYLHIYFVSVAFLISPDSLIMILQMAADRDSDSDVEAETEEEHDERLKRFNEPSQILPWLFLGSYRHTLNRQFLDKRSITYILNVRFRCFLFYFLGVCLSFVLCVAQVQDSARFPDLKRFKFAHVPINDFGRSDLQKNIFKKCFSFLAEAKENKACVLVHCSLVRLSLLRSFCSLLLLFCLFFVSVSFLLLLFARSITVLLIVFLCCCFCRV